MASDVIVGYRNYTSLIEDLTVGKQVLSSAMLQEVDRCRQAIELAASGRTVALVSSGDPGIYGMAGLAMEQAEALGHQIAIEVIPGISASGSAGALLGAPLMLDYATISLSDLLVPWEQIVRRLEAVAAADLVTVLYNPRSKKRIHQLEDAADIFLKHRSMGTPVGIASSIGLEDQNTVISTLGLFLNEEIGMRSTVIIGNTSTRIINGRMVTPRGYRL